MTAPDDLKVLPENDKPKLRLVIYPDESLKTPVAPFPEADLGTKLVKDTAGAMIQEMYNLYGVGLSAQQVGVPFQIFVTDHLWVKDNVKRPQVYLNPKIVAVGGEGQSVNEGCLSFPYNFRSHVDRFEKIELEWFDFKGEVHHEWFEGYEAIVIQHEYDHLLGYCFYDRLSRLKREMGFRKARKIRRRYRNGYKRGLREVAMSWRTKGALLERQRGWEKDRRDAKTR